MIGPLVRGRKLVPRSTPVEPNVRRRARNLLTDLFEYCVAPLARWEKEQLVIERVDIAIRGLAPAFDGYRIAFLTDLHTSPLVPRWWLDRAVAAVPALAPDLIGLGGDFLDDDPHYVATLADILAPLRAPDGVFGVLGNHDHYVGAQGVREQLARAGIRELLNRSVMLQRGAGRLAVGGVGDLECDVIDFATTVAGLEPDVPRIVLSHDPDVFAYWPRDLRLDLMLSGHTHGGQAFLPLVGPPYIPSQFGFRYLGGIVAEAGMQLYVSRGVGSSGVPFRWGCPPELTLLTLRPQLA